jgi:hypothetical protein
MVGSFQRIISETTAHIHTDKPDETLESDSKLTPGKNPMIKEDSKANK